MLMKDSLISVSLNDKAIEEIISKNIQDKLEEMENQKVFYTMQDLEFITGCSEGYIKDKFFYDSRFAAIRRKVGRKWLFPTDETKQFLLQWLKEQPNE